MSMNPQTQTLVIILTVLSLVVLISFLSFYLLQQNLIHQACLLWANSMLAGSPILGFIAKNLVCSVF